MPRSQPLSYHYPHILFDSDRFRAEENPKINQLAGRRQMQRGNLKPWRGFLANAKTMRNQDREKLKN
jgi:hypothetical protein